MEAALTLAAVAIGLFTIWMLGYLTGRVHGVRSGYLHGYQGLSDDLRREQK